MTIEPRSILIVDDEYSSQMTARLKLRRKCPSANFGFAGNRQEALQRCEEMRAEVIILDSDLDDCDGLQLIEHFTRSESRPRVVVYSGYLDPYTVFRVNKSSAMGFVDKGGVEGDALGKAVEAALSGRKFYTYNVQVILTELQERRHAFALCLSEREMQMLGELGCNYSDEVIAAKAGIAVATVGSHRQHIMKSLDLHTAADLMEYALNNGFTRKPKHKKIRPVAPLSFGSSLYL